MPDDKNAPYLLWEERLDTSFEYSYSVHNFQTFHPRAKMVGLARREERSDDGKVVREWGAILIHDKGFAAHEKRYTKSVVVVRRLGDVTPIPGFCGELLGSFVSDHGRWTWLVFLPREDAPPSARASEGAAPPARNGKAPQPAPRREPEAARTAAPSVQPRNESPPPPDEEILWSS
jgi:hypothetical protein